MYIFIMLSLLFVSLQIVKNAILGDTPFNNGSTCSLATKVIEVCFSLVVALAKADVIFIYVITLPRILKLPKSAGKQSNTALHCGFICRFIYANSKMLNPGNKIFIEYIKAFFNFLLPRR